MGGDKNTIRSTRFAEILEVEPSGGAGTPSDTLPYSSHRVRPKCSDERGRGI